jgi:DNA-directed RNA polymerase subunit RPC12/RpoP
LQEYKVKCNICGKIFNKSVESVDRNRIRCTCGGTTETIYSPPKDVFTPQTLSTHHVKCLNCGKEFQEIAWAVDVGKIRCACGGNTKICHKSNTSISCGFTMFGRENKPLVLEHMTEDDDDIVSVASKNQLREACKKHSCISPILD